MTVTQPTELTVSVQVFRNLIRQLFMSNVLQSVGG
jgi:hypothetical protein